MRDQDGHAVTDQCSEAVKGFILRAGIECGYRLIKDEYLSIPDLRTREGDLLPFTT